MKNSEVSLSAIIALVTLSGCGARNDASPLPAVGTTDLLGVVVKSRSMFEIKFSSGNELSYLQRIFHFLTLPTAYAGASVNQPISVNESPSTTMALDNSMFNIPNISNQLLDFGNLQITSLTDNNLRVCGIGGNQKCGTALIRLYTSGVLGSGIYNSTDGYGAPLQATRTSSLNVGLNVAGAAVMDSMSISNGINVLRLSNFSGQEKYDIKADFSNAGAGSYSTTLVVEYALAP